MKKEVLAPAKINLTLDILSKRADSYHEISSVMQLISLCDRISVRESTEPGIKIHSSLAYIPNDERNLCYKAAALYFERAGITGAGIQINIKKNIPVAAGMAGGSSDAAATLTALEEIYGALGDSLRELAPQIGADVLFCLEGKTCLCEGVGDILTPLESRAAGIHAVAAKNVRGLSTPYMYSRFDEVGSDGGASDTSGMKIALMSGSAKKIAPLLHNDFEKAAFIEKPEILRLKEMFFENGALGALMSGSGPTVFGLFSTGREAAAFSRKLSESGIQSYTARFI